MNRSIRSIRTASVAGAAAIALALAGCGGEAETPTTPTDGGDGTTQTEDTVTENTDTETGTQTQTEDAGSGSADAAVGDTMPAAELQSRITEALQAEGTVEMNMAGEIAYANYSSSGVNFVGEMEEDGGEIRFVDGVFYMEADDEMRQMNGDKAWLKISPDGDDLMSQMMGPVLAMMEMALDPATQLQAASDSTATVVDVSGSNVTYEVITTEAQMREMLEQLMGEMPEELQDSGELPEGDMTTLYTLDGQGRLVEVVSDMEGEESTTTYSYDSDYVVEAPAESEVGVFELNLDFGDLETEE
ncbi:MAG: hypothetical protein Q4G67_08915 [Actinomycetia bacterium]|nr:hypothetical protein [Actinomycetes bacterium]